MRESYGDDGREYSWESQDLVTYDDVFRMMSDRVKVTEHPVPNGCVGKVYSVGGIPDATRAILNHIGRHIEALQKKESLMIEENAG